MDYGLAALKGDDMAEEVTQAETISYFDPAYREDIAENKAGRLSERQHRLVANWGYEIPPEEKDAVLGAIKRRKPDRSHRALVFFLLGLVILVTMLIGLDCVPGYMVLMMWFLALWEVIPMPLSDKEVQELYEAETTARRKRFRTKEDARKIIRLEGRPNYETPSAVTMDGVAYSVEGPLWQWLRENSQHVAVYAIEGWYPRHALAVEPLDVPIPVESDV
ncbi:MAG: hypothetical protein IT320_03085 [Anaerolineae bacterium]|nr:hypothetical protein [Anaerolineae bacterium]